MDAIVVLDTAKPSMISMNEPISRFMNDPRVRKIEIDHHLGGDSAYTGDEGYRLVTDASSSCELIGHIALKLLKKKDLLERYEITNLFSRNLNLAILSGIIGDSQMGKFLKSNKEKRFYEGFSTMFNDLLRQQTVGKSNFGDMSQIFYELQRLSRKEEECHNELLTHMRVRGSFCFIVLGKDEMEGILRICEADTFVSIARSVTNILAEKSGKIGFIAYRDPADADLFQFKMRRSRYFTSYDLRSLLSLFSIEDGGGTRVRSLSEFPADRVPDLGRIRSIVSRRELKRSSRRYRIACICVLPAFPGSIGRVMLTFLFVLSFLILPGRSFPQSSPGESTSTAPVRPAPGAASESASASFDPAASLGMTLAEAFLAYGAPSVVFPVRGEEDWQDDVVFFYPSRLYLFWYENRVWQVRLDERYQGELLGCSMGMSEQDVTGVLGDPLFREADWAVYTLADRGYPVRARLVFTAGQLSDLYVYRSDF